MLRLVRKQGESKIGEDITVEVAEIKRGYVVLGIDAPEDVVILREELVEKTESCSSQSS